MLHHWMNLETLDLYEISYYYLLDLGWRCRLQI